MPEKKPDDQVVYFLKLPRRLRMEFKHACERQGLNMREKLVEMIIKEIEREKKQP